MEYHPLFMKANHSPLILFFYFQSVVQKISTQKISGTNKGSLGHRLAVRKKEAFWGPTQRKRLLKQCPLGTILENGAQKMYGKTVPFFLCCFFMWSQFGATLYKRTILVPTNKRVQFLLNMIIKEKTTPFLQKGAVFQNSALTEPFLYLFFSVVKQRDLCLCNICLTLPFCEQPLSILATSHLNISAEHRTSCLPHLLSHQSLLLYGTLCVK